MWPPAEPRLPPPSPPARSGRQIAPGLECPDRINGAIDKNDQRRPDRETVAMLRPPEMKRHKHQRAQQIDGGNDDEPGATQRQARKRSEERRVGKECGHTFITRWLLLY